jgi:hypothetical protein
MIDGLIATMLINEDLPPRPNATFSISPIVQDSIIRQSWISQLQLAESQSCAQAVTAQCFCQSTLPDMEQPKVATCMLAAQCNSMPAPGWRCNAAADPMTKMLLGGLLREHVTETLVQWAMVAGFAQGWYSQREAETDQEYNNRLVTILVEAQAAGQYDDVGYGHGFLSDSSLFSAAYARDHSCPVNSYASSVNCLPCPDGTEAPAGSTGISDCTSKRSDQAVAADNCVLQHTGCRHGCAMMLACYGSECRTACVERCHNCMRAAQPNSTAPEIAYCPVSLTQLPPSSPSKKQRQERPHPSDDSDDAPVQVIDDLARCQASGECVSLEIDAARARPYMFPFIIPAKQPNKDDTAWRFFWVLDDRSSERNLGLQIPTADDPSVA